MKIITPLGTRDRDQTHLQEGRKRRRKVRKVRTNDDMGDSQGDKMTAIRDQKGAPRQVQETERMHHQKLDPKRNSNSCCKKRS